MPPGPGGEKRPGDVIGLAAEVMESGPFDTYVRGLRADQQRLRKELCRTPPALSNRQKQ